MNATFGEVLQEVLTGFLIMEPEWRGVESKEDALKQIGFRDGVVLRLVAMHRLFEKERKGKRDKQKSTN